MARTKTNAQNKYRYIDTHFKISIYRHENFSRKMLLFFITITVFISEEFLKRKSVVIGPFWYTSFSWNVIKILLNNNIIYFFWAYTLKRQFSKSYLSLLSTYVGQSILQYLYLSFIGWQLFLTYIISVDLGKAFIMFSPVKQIHSFLNRVAILIGGILRYHKISFVTLNTLVTGKCMFSKKSFTVCYTTRLKWSPF